MNKYIFNIAVALLIFGMVVSCSSDDDNSNPRKTVKKERVSGISQKGPFVSGIVKLFELDENYKRTGESFSGSIKDKNGSYEITNIELASPYIEMEVTGKYINEITNAESKDSITLKAIADVTDKDKVNINVFTHLEHGKVLDLLKQGLSFATAKKKAFEAVLNELGIAPISKNSENMSLQADSVLLLASVLLQGGRSESELSTLLKTLNGIDKVKEGIEQALADYTKAKGNLSSSSSLGGSSSSITKYTFTDTRDNQPYVYVKIGEKFWMAQNLNYNVPNNDTDVCYENATTYCDIYGRLYNWATARAACPDGWHLPSNAEWKVMFEFISPNCFSNSDSYCNDAGTMLKAANGWDNAYYEVPDGTNNYGFSALPSGSGDSDGDFDYAGDRGYWWSSTECEDVSRNAYYLRMLSNREYANFDDRGNKETDLLSVRCVQN